MNVDHEQKPKSIGHDVTFAAFDFLTGVIAGNTPTFSGFYALTANDTQGLRT